VKLRLRKIMILYSIGVTLGFVLIFFSRTVSAQAENEDSTTIPNNGYYDSDEDYPSSPAEYASMLRENMTCLEPRCERQIMIELNMYFINDFEDAYRAYLLGAISDGGSFGDYIHKIQGIKVLEQFLSLHHFDKAAQFVKAKLTAPHPKICLGMQPSSESPGQYERECDYKKDDNCEKICMKQSLEQLASQISDSDRLSQALNAFNDSDSKSYSAIMGVCSVKNPNSSQKQNQTQGAYHNEPILKNQNRPNLCGILDSPSVIGALAGQGGSFLGGSQNDPAEYSCSYVRLNIDKTPGNWRLHPDELRHNYVVHADGKIYNLTADDLHALQSEVERLTGRKSPAIKTSDRPDVTKIPHTKPETIIYESQH
jgi:hypothetical protein